MLKLYKAANSICTHKVLITLAHKGLSFDTQDIDLFRNEQFSPSYLAINPKGVVPALDHDGQVVTESTLICEYLDETFPAPLALIPTAPYARTLMRKWSKLVDEKLFEATRELSFSAMFREKMRAMTQDQREGRFRNVGDPDKRARFMSTYELGVESPYVYQAVANYELAFREMEKALKTSGSGWLVGSGMTLADVNMMPFVARLAYLNLLEIWTAARPLTREWWSRAQTLPSFQTAVRAPMTAPESDAMATFGSKISDRVAAHRATYLAAHVA